MPSIRGYEIGRNEDKEKRPFVAGKGSLAKSLEQPEVAFMARSGSESARHLLLKKAAFFWAQKEGYHAVGTEITLPNCRYRADVAAYRPRRERREEWDPLSRAKKLVRRGVIGQTAVFECKQARADFLKDSQSTRRGLESLKKLHVRRETLERNLMVHYPSLRNGDSLFPEFESADLDRLEHEGYRKVLKEIATLQTRVYEKTKFEKMRRWTCANLFYIVVPEGLIEPHELPPGWGLLVLPETELERVERQEQQQQQQPDTRDPEPPEPPDPEQEAPPPPMPPLLEAIRKPEWLDSHESHRLELLQRLAVTGTRRRNAQWAMQFEAIVEARRRGL